MAPENPCKFCTAPCADQQPDNACIEMLFQGLYDENGKVTGFTDPAILDAGPLTDHEGNVLPVKTPTKMEMGFTWD